MIPSGPEIPADEAVSGKMHLKRGLLFVASQRSMAASFEFIQECTISFVDDEIYLD